MQQELLQQKIGILFCEHKLKHIKNLIEYLDPNLQNKNIIKY